MLYIGNNKIIKGYIGNTPIAYVGFGKSDLIKIGVNNNGGGEEVYPENTIAVYTVSGTSAVSPSSVSGKASDWVETHRNNGDGTSTMIITASASPTAISFSSKIELLNIKYLDISKITNMNSMFNGCTSLTKLDLSSWDTSNVTNMSGMFKDCTNLTSLNISNFSVESIEWKQGSSANQRYFNVRDMYLNCTSLTELRLDNCDNDTIKKLSNYSYTNKDTGSTTYYYWSPGLPTYTDGSVHNVYLKKSNWSSSTFRTGWTINYVEE